MAGEPLYAAYGFRAIERLEDATGGVPVPLVRMEKEVPGGVSRRQPSQPRPSPSPSKP